MITKSNIQAIIDDRLYFFCRKSPALGPAAAQLYKLL